jgi:hypothetical protein
MKTAASRWPGRCRGQPVLLTENNTCGHFQDTSPSASFQARSRRPGLAGRTAADEVAPDTHDGVTNNAGSPTTDLAGYCNACNTHPSTYTDDDGGFLRIFVGDYYKGCTAASAPAWASACSTRQYSLHGSNGSTWTKIDAILAYWQARAVWRREAEC